MKSHFDQVVDLGEHDDSEIKRAVLPHTELKYERALRIYDQFLAREQKTNDKELEARVLAACYKHFHLTIDSVDGKTLIVLTYQREYVKGYWRKKQWELPVHDIYREDMPLFLNFLAFFFQWHRLMAYSNCVLETIYFKESVFQTPVFRQFTELAIEKTTGKARGADSFGKALVELGHRGGYLRNTTVRASRRWVLMEAGMILASQSNGC
ncbi:hypothetical protein V8E54_001421 [Elaphomyces granulatus]